METMLIEEKLLLYFGVSIVVAYLLFIFDESRVLLALVWPAVIVIGAVGLLIRVPGLLWNFICDVLGWATTT